MKHFVTLATTLTLALLSLLAGALPGWAGEFVYDLHPMMVAKDTYVLLGDTHFFNPDNGGNIANTGFIVTTSGVVVIDTGPSRRYGEAMRAVIAKITPLPVVKVLITHAHTDHFLGSQAFSEAGVYSGAPTVEMIRAHGQEMAANLYTMLGAVMSGTEPVVPQLLDRTEDHIGGHDLRYYQLAGHTESDLVIFDRTTGVLFTGDLVFFRRALAVPNANVAQWEESLRQIEAIPYRKLVPGHGAPCLGPDAIAETRDYLHWLDQALRQALADGLDLTEALHLRVPERFRALAIVHEEFQRSVGQLFPRLESESLPSLAKAGSEGPNEGGKIP